MVESGTLRFTIEVGHTRCGHTMGRKVVNNNNGTGRCADRETNRQMANILPVEKEKHGGMSVHLKQ